MIDADRRWSASLKDFLKRSAASRPVLFGIAMILIALFIKIPFAPLILWLPGGDTTGPVAEGGVALVLFSFLLLPVETLLGQALPIGTFRILRVKRWRSLIICSAFCFGILHLVAGPGAFFVGFSGGLAFALCWLCWAEVSWWRAFSRTTLVHMAHNAVALTFYFVIPE